MYEQLNCLLPGKLALIKKYNIRIFDYNNELKKFECFTKLYTNDLRSCHEYKFYFKKRRN